MQPLNAIDALTPALSRTHEILFRPFRFGGSWKLAACQYFGMMGAFFVPFPVAVAFLPSAILPQATANSGAFRGVLFALLTLATALCFGLFYLALRMQFVNFEMVVTRATFIGPMWRRYGKRIWPMVWLKTAIPTLMSLVMVPLLWNTAVEIIHLTMSMPKSTPGNPADPSEMFAVLGQMMRLEGVVVGAFLLIKLFSTLVEDFVLPFYILEDISLYSAVSRGWNVLITDPLHCLLYMILKPILFCIGFVMQYITMLIAMVPVVIVGVIGAVAAAVLTKGMGGAGHVLVVAAGVVLYLLFVVAMLWYQCGTLGYISLLLEAYGAYFLGGRYPLLGAMLESGPGAPFTPPPVFPSDDERDNSGGPPMPMDPAVA